MQLSSVADLLCVASVSFYLEKEPSAFFFFFFVWEKGGGGYLLTKRLMEEGGVRVEQLKYGQILVGSYEAKILCLKYDFIL